MATTAADKPKARRTPRAAVAAAPASDKTSGSTGAFIVAGAAGAVLGIVAMIGRKVAVQAPTALAGDWDEALAAEHAAVAKVFEAIKATTTKNTTRRAILLAQLKHALAKHALQEENSV